MIWSGHRMMDPSEMESRYAEEAGMAFMDGIFDTPREESHDRIEMVRTAMLRLPALEADFVDLFYFRRWKQTNIAALYGVAQPTVHYRLSRATARIRYLLEMPQHDPVQLQQDLHKALVNPAEPAEGVLNVRIMLLMLETTCQTAVANILGITQGKARHRFLSMIDALTNAGLDLYVRVFDHVRRHLNIMWEVQKQPEDRVLYVVV